MTVSVDQWRGVAAETNDDVPAKLSLLLRKRTRALLGEMLAPHKRLLWVYVAAIVVCGGGMLIVRRLAPVLLSKPSPRVPEPVVRRRAVVPVWRRPWMAVGRDTFTGAVLARLGVDNVLADDSPGEYTERYPRIDPATLPPHDLVVLPDEPYLFTADDGPEAFAAPSVLVSGRLLTWYGPSLTEAARVLPPLLAPDSRMSDNRP